MNENWISYRLKAIHQSFDDDEHEINTYERIYHVELLQKQDGVMYDKALKIHSEQKAIIPAIRIKSIDTRFKIMIKKIYKDDFVPLGWF